MRFPLIIFPLLAMALSGCNAVNAWVAGAENNVVTDAAGAANNLHTANVAAAEAWARSACALTLGGLAGASSTTITETAMKNCTPAGVSIGGIAAPNGNAPVGNPFALPGQAGALVQQPAQITTPAPQPVSLATPAKAASRMARAAPVSQMGAVPVAPVAVQTLLAPVLAPVTAAPVAVVAAVPAPVPVVPAIAASGAEPTGGAIP